VNLILDDGSSSVQSALHKDDRLTEEERGENQVRIRPAPEDAGLETTSIPGDGAIERDDDTVGTGSAIALGCIAGTLLLIVIGLILIALFALAR
jgi:hypothetical protein